MNEDGIGLKSTYSIKKRNNEDKKLQFKNRLKKTLEILENLLTKITPQEMQLSDRIANKSLKLSFLTFVLAGILFLYYFYIYWYLVPSIESTKTGLSFDLYLNWGDEAYRKRIIIFLIFHFILFLFILSLIRTLFTNAGYIEYEYLNLFSIVKFIKHLCIYFTKWRDSEFKFMEMLANDKSTFLGDLSEIKEIKPILIEKLTDFSNSISASALYVSRYYSIDVTKKKGVTAGISENDEIENKEKQAVSALSAVSLSFQEDVIESYENDLDNFIRSNQLYTNLNNLIFYEKSKDASRFCGFCLVKKPDRAHHCRQCKKCLRKMDHHCTYLYTCIGHGNYKFFILTLFYASLIVVFMSVTLIDGLRFYIDEYSDNLFLSLFCLIFLLLIIISTSIVYFFFLHVYLLLKNMTTIEYKEKLLSKTDNNYYFKTSWDSLVNVLGCCLLWLLPIRHEPLNDGYSFEINKDIYNKILVEKFSDSSLHKSKYTKIES